MSDTGNCDRFVQRRASAPSAGPHASIQRKHSWLQRYNKHILLYNVLLYRGSFCWKKKMYKADLNNLICIPTTDGQEKEKVPFFFVCFCFLQTSKISIDRHSYFSYNACLVTQKNKKKTTTPESNSIQSWCQFRGTRKPKKIRTNK